MVLGTLRQRCRASLQWRRQRQEDRAGSEQRHAPHVDDGVCEAHRHITTRAQLPVRSRQVADCIMESLHFLPFPFSFSASKARCGVFPESKAPPASIWRARL
eukprot:5027981-Pleurochrysis_carterae.AAC.1